MISVIVVNYNTWDLTEKLCRTINAHHHLDGLELIIVDNQSKNPPPPYFSETNNLSLILSPTNSGFAGGVNQGVRVAKHEHLVTLNSDIILPEDQDFFQPLISRLQDSKVAACSPKIIYSRDYKIQFAGFTPINPYSGRGFGIGYGEKDKGKYNTPRKTARCHGAAMAFKKSCWKEVGGMFEPYFLYYEEMDFCAELKSLGYQLWYEPASVAHHYGSFSVDESATPKIFYVYRNRIWYLRRQTSFLQRCISIPYMAAMGLFKGFVYWLKGKKGNARFILKGTREGIFINVHAL